MNDTDITLSREDAENIELQLLRARDVIKVMNPTLGKKLNETAMGIKAMLNEPAAKPDEVTSTDPE